MRLAMFRLTVLFGILNICNGVPDCTRMPPDEDFEHCCVKSKRMNEIAYECDALHPTSDSLPLLNFCLNECILNKTGLIQNRLFDISHATKILDGFYDDKKYLSTVVTALQKCMVTEQKFAQEITKTYPQHVKKCPAMPAILNHCLTYEMFINCPEAAWRGTKNCNHSREFINHCMGNE